MVLSRFQLRKDTLFELARIALPMVVSQGTFAVMIFTDRYFMSQIDSVHMAAALGGGVAAFFHSASLLDFCLMRMHSLHSIWERVSLGSVQKLLLRG